MRCKLVIYCLTEKHNFACIDFLYKFRSLRTALEFEFSISRCCLSTIFVRHANNCWPANCGSLYYVSEAIHFVCTTSTRTVHLLCLLHFPCDGIVRSVHHVRRSNAMRMRFDFIFFKKFDFRHNVIGKFIDVVSLHELVALIMFAGHLSQWDAIYAS